MKWKKKWKRLIYRDGKQKQSGGMPVYTIYVLKKNDYAIYGAAGILLSALLAYLFYQSMLFFLFTAPVLAVLTPYMQQPKLQKKQQQRLSMEFKEAAGFISSFLGAGYSPENAIAAAEIEMERTFGKDAMMTAELRHMVSGIRLNKSAEALLAEFAERSGIEDIQSFAEVFCIARQSGGNLREIMNHTVSVLRDKMSVMEELRTLTASRRYEQNVMTVLPAGIILYMNLTSPDFLERLYQGAAGRIIMTICLLLFASAHILAGKILDIQV